MSQFFFQVCKEDLPFRSPYKEMWKNIKKAIDRLHLSNHKRPRCHSDYNADKILPKEFNTMVCEQVFAWFSRFKRICCAMPKNRQLFFLHRTIIRRNAYTSKCRVAGISPSLPVVKPAKFANKGVNKYKCTTIRSVFARCRRDLYLMS